MNKIMYRKSMTCIIALFANALIFSLSHASESPSNSMANEKTKIAKTLDSLHRYAASAEGEKYFSLFTENALYIGTDVSETWSIDEFKQFAAPYFNQGKGWLYTVKSRTITLSQNQGYAWFVEVLDNEKYGVSRGTGVLVNSHGKWRIAQYHLTFPIPNSLAESITQQIKSAAK